MNARRRRLLKLSPLILAGFALFLGLGGLVVRELWNWLVPAIIGWGAITFWQALGLLLLCRILFGGFGGGGWSGGRHKRRMAERWDAMTPEERERFRQGLRSKFGMGPSGPEAPARRG